MISDNYAIVEGATPIEYVVYVPKALVITTLPYTKFEGAEFVRQNGNHRLSILAPETVGIPYGVIPRLLLVWVATEAKIRKTRDIELGRSFREFMSKLNLQCTGGKNGTIVRVRKQLRSLFYCSISSSLMADEWHDIEFGMRLADHSYFWWQPHSEFSFKAGHIKLSGAFYNQVDYEGSPMALHIYMWLSWRVFSVKKVTLIPWIELQKQFGANYKKGWNFERAFSLHLVRIKQVYPQVLAHAIKGRVLILYPSQTHVLPRCV